MSTKLFEQKRFFGDSRLLDSDEGAEPQVSQSFFDLPLEQQAEALGWSAACPVTEELIQPRSQGGRGAKEMRNRYGQIIFWLHYVQTIAEQKDNTKLALQLATPTQRLKNEPVGYYDESSVPTEYLTYMFKSPAAHALPRVMLTYANKDIQSKFSSKEMNEETILEINQTQDNTAYVLDILDELIAVSQTPNELVVLLVENLFKKLETEDNLDTRIALLHNLFGIEKLEEDNCYHAYRQLFTQIKIHAPRIVALYQALAKKSLLDTFNIADLESFPDDLPAFDLEQSVRVLSSDFGNHKIKFEVQFSPDEIVKLQLIQAFITKLIQVSSGNKSRVLQEYFSKIRTLVQLSVTDLSDRKKTMQTIRESLLITDHYVLQIWDQATSTDTAALMKIQNDLTELLEELDIYPLS